MTRSNNHVLIDYENVQPEFANLIAPAFYKIWVFVGALQHKVKFDLVELLQAKGSDAKVIKMGGTGPNALDFHMAYHLGRLCVQEPNAYFHVITKDKDLDPLLTRLREDGLHVQRCTAVSELPMLILPSTTPDDDKLSRVIEYLIDRGKQRPASLKTLMGTVASRFQPKLGESETINIVEQLKATGVVALDGNKVRYGLPDGG